MGDQEVLLATDIHKSFRQPHGKPIPVLEGINLRLRDHERVAIVGPSGCGKSTLLHILGLMEKPDRGEIKLLDKHIPSINERGRDAIRRQ